MDKILKSKKILLTFIFIVILGLSYLLFFSSKSTNENIIQKEPTENEVIPTVDSSVQVSLDKTGNDVNLSIKGIPGNTDKLEYELSYETAEQGLQGIGPSSVEIANFKNDGYEKKITLGTCSSGRCVYHKVIGKIKLQIRFTGTYGDKIFEHDYEV